MPKQMFCSKCGMDLILIRKAISGNILDLIDPHTCDDYHLHNLSPSPVEIATENISETSDKVEGLLDTFFDKPKDNRNKKDLRVPETSSAPRGIRNALVNSMSENDLSD